MGTFFSPVRQNKNERVNMLPENLFCCIISPQKEGDYDMIKFRTSALVMAVALSLSMLSACGSKEPSISAEDKLNKLPPSRKPLKRRKNPKN